MKVGPQELVDAGDAAAAARLQAWRSARGRFLQAGLRVQPSPDPARMLAQVQAPLLEVLSTSADFRPAYDPLLMMAQRLATQDPAAARSLLQQLAQKVPNRREAADALAAPH
jgi:spermidine synthase